LSTLDFIYENVINYLRGNYFERWFLIRNPLENLLEVPVKISLFFEAAFFKRHACEDWFLEVGFGLASIILSHLTISGGGCHFQPPQKIKWVISKNIFVVVCYELDGIGMDIMR